jgi:hypothetical protein
MPEEFEFPLTLWHRLYDINYLSSYGIKVVVVEVEGQTVVVVLVVEVIGALSSTALPKATSNKVSIAPLKF